MFESILEKAILKYLDEYLQNFNKKNISLGIWRGNLKIQNLQFKEKIFSSLNIPIKVSYSQIDSLEIIVPWNKLSVLPVEIEINTIFLILTPINEEEWNIPDENIEEKLQFISDIIANFLKKEDPKLNNNSQKSEGYLSKLIAKITDNLQISIKNLHVRLENNIKKNDFTFGICLQELKFLTMDSEWKNPHFYDRSNKKNRDLPINKLVNFKGFGIYCNNGVESFLKNADIHKRMLEIFQINNEGSIIEKNKEISKSSNSIKTNENKGNQHYKFILKLTSELRMTKNFQIEYFTCPEYLISLDIHSLNIDLQNFQIQNLIKFLEFLNHYNNILTVKASLIYLRPIKPSLFNLRSRQNQNITLSKNWLKKIYINMWIWAIESVILQMRQSRFVKIISQILIKRIKLTKSIFEKNNRFVRLLQYSSKDDLQIWTEFTIKRLLSENKSIKGSVFSDLFNWRRKDITIQEYFLSDQEISDLNRFFNENNYYGKTTGSEKGFESLEPSSYIRICFSFTVSETKIKIARSSTMYEEEGLNMMVTSIFVKCNICKSSFAVEFKVSDIAIDIFNKRDKESEININIFKKLVLKNQNLINIAFESNPPTNSDFSWRILAEIKSFEVKYYPLLMKKIYSYFQIVSIDEELRTQAFLKIKKIKEKSLESLENFIKTYKKTEVCLKINEPVLIIPFLQNNDLRSPCFVANLKNFQFFSDDHPEEVTNTENLLNKQNSIKFYEFFNLEIINLNLSYWNSLKAFYSKNTDEIIEEKGTILQICFNLIFS